MNEGIRLRALLVIVPVHFVNRIARMGRVSPYSFDEVYKYTSFLGISPFASNRKLSRMLVG